MRITRIFRKYSRLLMLVAMAGLLVVFLLGDVIGRAARSQMDRDVEIGTAFGEPVYWSQTRSAEGDFELAGWLGARPPWINTDNPQKRNIAMYLLMEEARRAGIRVGREQVIEGFRRAPGSSSALDAVRKRTRLSLNSIYDSLARVTAVRLLASYQAAAADDASLPELERIYRDRNQEARVLISGIDANAFLPSVPAPSEEELQAHFEQAKDREAEHTDEALAYGYRIPNRVQVEYLTVDPDEIKEDVIVSKRERLRYYAENKHKYVKTVEDTSPFTLEDAQPQTLQMTYEEVADRVREDCRAAKAVLEAQRLVNAIYQEARRPWDTAPLGADNVREIPPEAELVSFTALQARFSGDYPVSYKKTELVTERELGSEPGFGRASTVVGRQPVSTPALAFRVAGLVTPEPNDPMPILRIDEPGPFMLEARSGGPAAEPMPHQAYVFRVIHVAPSGPPASLEDVREEAVKNVERTKAFALAGEHARELAEQARQVGLTQAVESAEALKALLGQAEEPAANEPTAPPTANRYVRMLEPFEPRQFLRQPRPFQNIGFAPHLPEQVFALASEDGPDAADTHRVVVVPVAKSLRWAVVERLEIKPIYEGDFKTKRAELEQQSAWSRTMSFTMAWFDPDNIFSRTGWVPATQTEQ